MSKGLACKTMFLFSVLAFKLLNVFSVPQKASINASVTIPEVQQDFSMVLNESESSISDTLLFRYPYLLQVITEIVNQNSSVFENASSFNEYELCQLVKNSLASSQDTCKKPYSSPAVKSKCEKKGTTGPSNSTTPRPIFYDICKQFNTSATPMPKAHAKAFKMRRMRRVINYPLLNATAKNLNEKITQTSQTNSSFMTTSNQTVRNTATPNRNQTTLASSNRTSNNSQTMKPSTLVRTTASPPTTTVFPATEPETTERPVPGTQLHTTFPQTVPPTAVRATKLPDVGEKEPATNYFFLAIKVIAKTVIISNERKCRNRNGMFDQKENVCRIPIRNKEMADANASLSNNITNFTIISFPVVNGNTNSLRIINIAGNTCSTVCLLVLAATYFIVKDHFSLPDKSILCLSGSLTLSHVIQLLIIFFASNNDFCKTTGILLHWALLLAFFWMAVISFDFFITFTKMRPISPAASKARFKKYVAIVTSSASIIVLVCIFIGIPVEDFSGYGSKGRCFVSKFWANLLAFALPVAVILLTNIFLLLVTINKLRCLRAANRKILASPNSHSSRKKMMLSVMTLKLSVLFGLGWLFGYLDGLVSSQALEYCYNLIVSFQGAFVFLAFGCHKKMLDFCRCSRIRHRHARASRSSADEFTLKSTQSSTCESKF